MASGDEVDRWDVAAGAGDVALESTVQLDQVQLSQAAGVGYSVLTGERQVVHAAQHTAVGGLGDPSPRRVEDPEGVRRETLGGQLVVDARDDEGPERAEVAGANVGDEDRQEAAGMRDEKTLAAVDPQEVGVPVVFGCRQGRCRGVRSAHQLLQLGRAAKDEHARAYDTEEPASRRCGLDVVAVFQARSSQPDGCPGCRGGRGSCVLPARSALRSSPHTGE